ETAAYLLSGTFLGAIAGGLTGAAIAYHDTHKPNCGDLCGLDWLAVPYLGAGGAAVGFVAVGVPAATHRASAWVGVASRNNSPLELAAGVVSLNADLVACSAANELGVLTPGATSMRRLSTFSFVMLSCASAIAAQTVHQLPATPSTVAYGYYWSEAKPAI